MTYGLDSEAVVLGGGAGGGGAAAVLDAVEPEPEQGWLALKDRIAEDLRSGG